MHTGINANYLDYLKTTFDNEFNFILDNDAGFIESLIHSYSNIY